MDSILAGLNDAQKSAVTSPAAVLQVLAPPGSGKTKTLTSRVAYLIAQRQYRPWNIIVCTFTVKAAREMKERIRAMVGDELASKLLLGTFHSVSRRFLVSYGNRIGIEKNFGIADSSDTLAIIKRIIKRLNLNIEPGVARSRISGMKAKSINPVEYAASLKSTEKQEFSTVYTEYEAALKASSLLDYDDLLLRCCDLLRLHPECVSNIEAVLIDEFQDTNTVQLELMGFFAQEKKIITIVGDPDQSIYGFRSAEIKNLKRMRKLYPGTIAINLEENYRSSGAILLSALQVIEQDESRPSKPLQATHCVGEKPVLRKLPTAAAEAAWLVQEVQRTMALSGTMLNYSDYAVLLRSAALSRHIESALGKAGIPYRMVGGHRFFDRLEVKIILDYLRIISQPTHNDALVRIINVPSRKIGELTVRNLLEEAEGKKTSLWELILKAAQGNAQPKTKISTQAEKGIQSLVNIILTSRKKLCDIDGEDGSLTDLMEHLLRKLDYETYLRKNHPEDFESRWANVEELMAQAVDIAAGNVRGADEIVLPDVEGFEQQTLSSSEDMLARFLANVALSTEIEKNKETGDEQQQQLTISTIHAAKGLEWPVVFIPSAYEGSIPHSRAEDPDEERRLLYVGMTRAQALLYLSCPTKNSQREDTKLSSFLSSRSLNPYFDRRAPSLGFSSVQDLAQILRRECPTENLLDSCRTQLERLEDDLWPLDGGEIQIENDPWDNATFTGFELASKRRRPVEDYSRNVRMKPVTLGANCGITVTAQNTSSFSTSSMTVPTVGFTTASVQMSVFQQQETARALAKEKIPKLMRSTSNSSETKTSKKSVAGQTSLSSFFISKPASSRKNLDAPQDGASDGSGQAYQAQRAALKTTHTNAKVKTTSVMPVNQILDVVEKATKVEVVKNRYVLLSSSPPRPNDENSYVTAPHSPSQERPSKRQLPGQLMNATSGFKPAASFHTTSMAQIGQTSTQRKTLGMRRSLQGWTAKPAPMTRPTGVPRPG